MKQSLYIKDAKGKMRIWSIEQKEDGIEVIHGLVSGKKQREFEHIDFGLANRSKQEQIQSRFDSMIKRRLEKGYSKTIDAARNKNGKGLNDLGFPRPMLAQKFDASFSGECFVQPKLDGHRCLIAKSSSSILAYSRNGKVINSVDHILQILKNIPGNFVLDGELYIHGTALQTISSLVRKKQKESALLSYFVYDVVEQIGFVDRLSFLKDISKYFDKKAVDLLSTYKANGDLKKYFDAAMQAGFEGLMIRCPNTEYESGKRSKSLMKMKKFQDAEFKAVDIRQSADGWGIVVCETKSGKRFSVTAPGTASDKLDVADRPDVYIGLDLTVEYAGLTKDGIPFHPVAKCWRQDV
jgi:ATP-dependent DNA ligase